MSRALLIVSVLTGCLLCGCARLEVNRATGLAYYVSLSGDDANSGGRGAPFATLERAREAVRRLNQTGVLPQGGVTVFVRGGRYERRLGFALDARDSGQEGRPVVYRAFPGETVVLTGGVLIAPETLRPPEPATSPALSGVAAGQVRCVEIAALPGAAAGLAPAGPPAELFFAGRPLPRERSGDTAGLDLPGEWCFEGQARLLVLWPPRGIERAPLELSVLGEPILTIDQAEHVTWQGFTLECVRGAGAVIKAGTDNLIAGCTVRNTGEAGITVGGSGNGVAGCDIYGTGASGIVLEGGDRIGLAASGNYADNNHIHDTARHGQADAAGIRLGGVGQRATHNLIHGVPHSGISYGGNEHRIEFNEILQTCLSAGPGAALYTTQDWGSQGNTVRCNFVHHTRGAGVCLDGGDSGDTIEQNVFCQAEPAVAIVGGRYNTLRNNLYVDCTAAVHVARLGSGPARPAKETAEVADLRSKLEAMNYRQPPWCDRYPRLANILDDQPDLPLHNEITRNVCVRGAWIDAAADVLGLLQVGDNLVLPDDPGFVDPKRLDFRLREDSAVWAALPGFEAIPFRRIGLYRDALRATWPVQPPVRSGL